MTTRWLIYVNNKRATAERLPWVIQAWSEDWQKRGEGDAIYAESVTICSRAHTVNSWDHPTRPLFLIEAHGELVKMGRRVLIANPDILKSGQPLESDA